ncbi:MAG: tetratricopeptide repeat protein [Dehalococcoidales bacterium]|nr:tetratricopeptide repeat protein [Dehalococcoidales bacterium]
MSAVSHSWLVPFITTLVAAIVLVMVYRFSERKTSRRSVDESIRLLREQEAFFEKRMVKAKSNNIIVRNLLQLRLKETKAELLGLYRRGLQNTLGGAGLPAQGLLIGGNDTLLTPQQIASIEGMVDGLKARSLLESAEDLSLLAEASYYIGRYEDAESAYDRVLRLKPNNPNILYNLACLDLLQGKTDNALGYLKRVIDKDEKFREIVKTNKAFNSVRDDPRFRRLVE